MMCILVKGESWEGLRSVEIIAHHHKRRKIKILFLLLMNNRKNDNYLEILHPGNSHCKIVNPWKRGQGLPYHQDEKRETSSDGIFNSVYGSMFEERDGKLYQVAELNPNESMYGLEHEREVTVWPETEPRNEFLKETGETDKDKSIFVPFTTWQFGPFHKTGIILITFEIVLEKESYDELIGGREYFPVFGPDRLRSKIKHDFIPSKIKYEDHERWQSRLEVFEEHINFQKSYDVIILKKPRDPSNYTIEADLIGSCNISLAASDKQPTPNELSAERYVTMDEYFKLNLFYQETRNYWANKSKKIALGKISL